MSKTLLRNLADSVLSLALVGATLGALPSIVGARHWMLDNLTSGTLHLFVVIATLSVIAFARRKRRSAIFAACTAALLGCRIYPELHTIEEAHTPAVASWLVANVHTANLHHDALLALVRERKPDVIGLVETDSRWLRALDEPLRAYPYRVLHPREDNFGIALFSRVPLVHAEVADFGIAPTITAAIKLGNREVELVLVHVLPPISPDYTQDRNEELARLGRLRPLPGHGMVIAGDFNATPYSPTFRDSFDQPPFKRIGDLTGTFPAMAHPALRIPIDHVLAAGSVNVRRTVERDIMSDHMPLLLELWSTTP